MPPGADAARRPSGQSPGPGRQHRGGQRGDGDLGRENRQSTRCRAENHLLGLIALRRDRTSLEQLVGDRLPTVCTSRPQADAATATTPPHCQGLAVMRTSGPV